MRRAFVCAAVVLLVFAVAAPSAFAHSAFLGSDPEPGERLEKSPRQVSLTFTEPLNDRLSRATLVEASDGRPAPGVRIAASGKRLVLRLSQELGRGAYRVQWHTVSTDDGHALEGSFSFGVRAPAVGGEHDVEQSPFARDGWIRIAARTVMYATLLLFSGALLLDALLSRRRTLWLAPESLTSDVPTLDRGRVERRYRRLIIDVGVIAVAAAAFSAVADAEDAAGGISPRGLSDFLLGNLAGLNRLYIVAFAMLALMGAAMRVRMAAVAALVALAAVALSGHANAASPRGVAVAADWVHLVATAVWLGGIAVIVIVWWPALRQGAQAERLAIARRVLPRFGQVALPAFAVLVVTGLVSAIVELGHLPALWETDYGRVLAQVFHQGERLGHGRGARSVRLSREFAGCDSLQARLRRITLKVQRDGRLVTVTVAADGDDRTVNHVGAALLRECAERVGLPDALSVALGSLRARQGRHDPGRTLLDLAVVIADGGRSVADLRVVREQGALFGPVASDATAWRTVTGAAEVGLLDQVRQARAAARERAWQAGAAPSAGPLIIDIDATLITTHTEKDGTAGTFKGGWGFAPLLAFLDGTREPLAAKLRPGNAPAHTAADHIEVLELALAQIPAAERAARPVLVRCDSGGQTHAFTAFCAEAGLAFAVTLNHYPALAEAIAGVDDRAWTPAVDEDGQPRENGHVVELTDALDLTAWPEGSRVIVRRERPHPGAQLRLADVDGFRYQAILTSQTGPAIAQVERTHRQRGRCEQRVCALKDTGARNLPFGDQAANALWLELCLTAADLICWTQHLALDGELAVCEPRTLRYRLLHTAGRLAFHARAARLRIPRTWPWAGELAAAFSRLAALPAAA